jgi:hypothetical protein
MHYLQIVDSTHKLQQHDQRSANVSDMQLEAIAELNTSINLAAALLGNLACPRGHRGGLWGFGILSNTCAIAILFHYIGASVSRESIGL